MFNALQIFHFVFTTKKQQNVDLKSMGSSKDAFSYKKQKKISQECMSTEILISL